ncbi:hypothetical protein HO133_005475 [Letharia lupina]|uniref:Uncharacterized protein n=1 Tax=Letharia lupina TaxID=560253 RepID=A0A8H6F896_9LECA|nr:uncharacterized protein HO133_005475 [Letharia lupina]KAF6218932.1 hypothetical protein HO133_005475 [Letharia lupina]
MDWLGCLDPGGGAYVFAKRSVNADKKARHEEEMKRRRLKDALDAEFYAKPPSPKQGHKRPHDHANSPSTEASHDPAPTEHPLENGGTKDQEEARYVASKPYKSKKGDRFS